MQKRKLTKEELLNFFRERKKPLGFEEILNSFSPRGKERKALKNLLLSMKRDGEIIKLRNRSFALPGITASRTEEISGTIDATRFGYAFLVPDNPSMKDIFISGANLRGALHKDYVLVKIISRDGRTGKNEGAVSQILERGIKTLIGRYSSSKKGHILYPTDKRITAYVLLENPNPSLSVEEGDIVSTEILWDKSTEGILKGRVTENFAQMDDPANDNKLIILKHGLRTEFGRAIGEEVKELSSKPADISKRRDLRGISFITIDPSDAKDFDDAVYAEEKKDGGFTVWVSIADVAEIVREDSELDREAYLRGTSFYFPGEVVPMLPHEISSGTCTLAPDSDKLAVTAKIELSPSMSVRNYEIFESVIRSKLRTTYEAVQEVLDGKPSEIPHQQRELILLAHRVSSALFSKRMSQAGIDFDLPEAKYVFGGDGSILDIKRAYRTDATQLIEEFMLLANKTVCRFIADRGVPQIYRVHEEPDPKKIGEFYEKARSLGLFRRSMELSSSKELNGFVKGIRDEGTARTLRYLLLRSMKQARYSPINKGHYGLGFDFYAHFTSPIRRYPDLVTHRIVKKLLRGSKEHLSLPFGKGLDDTAGRSSIQERLAGTCERDILNIKCVRFMKDRVGSVFTGYICGEISGGFFVELKEHMVEGFCSKDEIERKSSPRKRYSGFRKSSHRYAIGDQIKVKLIRASLEEGFLSFSILS